MFNDFPADIFPLSLSNEYLNPLNILVQKRNHRDVEILGIEREQTWRNIDYPSRRELEFKNAKLGDMVNEILDPEAELFTQSVELIKPPYIHDPYQVGDCPWEPARDAFDLTWDAYSAENEFLKNFNHNISQTFPQLICPKPGRNDTGGATEDDENTADIAKEKDEEIINTSNSLKKKSLTPMKRTIEIVKLESEEVKQGRWNTEEEEKFIKLLDKYGKNWVKIAEELGNRSRFQAMDKYKNLCKINFKLADKFSAEEDDQIILLVQMYGRNWEKIAQFFQRRSPRNIKNRYYSKLRRLASKNSHNIDKEEKTNDNEHTTELSSNLSSPRKSKALESKEDEKQQTSRLPIYGKEEMQKEWKDLIAILKQQEIELQQCLSVINKNIQKIEGED